MLLLWSMENWTLVLESEGRDIDLEDRQRECDRFMICDACRINHSNEFVPRIFLFLRLPSNGAVVEISVKHKALPMGAEEEDVFILSKFLCFFFLSKLSLKNSSERRSN